MEFRELLQIVGDEPVFETGLLLAGPVDPADVRRQLSRWTASGRLIQLKHGLYALTSPYQKTRPHLFLVANRVVRGSYVSLQSALAHEGLIPEYVAITTSVTMVRPGQWETLLGTYSSATSRPACSVASAGSTSAAGGTRLLPRRKKPCST